MDRYYVDYQGQAPFTGKERDRETGFSYFGARYYDSDLSGLFLSVDPMADKYPSISPYAYCMWNPIILKDPNGMIIDSATLTQEIKDLTNPESRKYNSDFSDIIQKLNYDPTTLFRFCNWDEPQIDEKTVDILVDGGGCGLGACGLCQYRVA